jgi:hypothetical protein
MIHYIFTFKSKKITFKFKKLLLLKVKYITL